MKRRSWTRAEDRLLRELYPIGTELERIADQLGRPVGSVESRVRKLGITRDCPEDWRRKTERDRKLLHDFLTIFMRTHVLAERRGIHISKAQLFVPFLQVYTTQGAFNGRTRGGYLSDWEQTACSD